MAQPNGSGGGNRLPVPADEQGLADLWRAYESHSEAIQAETQARFTSDPELVQIMERYASRAQPPEESNRLMRAALLDGQWEPYFENLRGEGAFYSREGLDFHMWPKVVNDFANILWGKVTDTYPDDRERMVRCLAALREFIDVILVVIAQEYMRDREARIVEQMAIRELSTPILPLKPNLLVVPIIGDLDPPRARQLSQQLLEAIRHHRARMVLLDVTGVPALDTGVAAYLLRMVQAARLMGARSVLTGISTTNAETLVRLGINLEGITTTADLQQGLQAADQLLANGRPW